MKQHIDGNIFRLVLGANWPKKLCTMLGYHERHAYRISAGEHVPRRRQLMILQTYARQKLGASSSRRARLYQAADRQIQKEDDAIRAALAWCAAELEKKK